MTSLFTIHRAFKKQGESLPLHAHGEGQLTFAASGIVQIHTDQGIWLVPPRLAAWIPSGVRHRIEIMADAELWIVLCQSSAIQKWPATRTIYLAAARALTRRFGDDVELEKLHHRDVLIWRKEALDSGLAKRSWNTYASHLKRFSDTPFLKTY